METTAAFQGSGFRAINLRFAKVTSRELNGCENAKDLILLSRTKDLIMPTLRALV